MAVTRRQLLCLLGALPVLGAHDEERQDDETIFTADVKVVSVLASVRDAQGRLVRDLGRDDFRILEDGRQQQVRYFSRDSALPLTLGLLVDTSLSQEHVIDIERAASFRFLDRVLREDKDRFFAMQFDMNVKMAQRLTASRDQLEQALVFVNTPTRRELRAQTGGGTLLFDAVVQAANGVLNSQKGRKAMVILSDGGENGSDASLEDAIEAAQRADALIYSILFGGTEGRSILQRLSRETGGGYYEVTKKMSLDAIYAQMEEELRGQYNLGFVSDTPSRISQFRKLQVSVERKGMKVQARDRYWAQR
jgi:VWFA-related protein